MLLPVIIAFVGATAAPTTDCHFSDVEWTRDCAANTCSVTAVSIPQSCTTLNLSATNIGDDAAHAIAAALVRESSLTTLSLHGNNIGDDGAQAIAAALERNSVLTALYMGANKIENKGARALATSLQSNSALAKLDMWANKVDGSVEQLVFQALRRKPARTHGGEL